MSEKNWTDEIFNSIQLIANESVKKARNNIIEDVIIEEVKGRRKYIVNNGSIRYTAYGASGTEYNEKDNVYVMIPQGDYNQKKIILGDYSYETSWAPSEGDFINVTGNLIKEPEKEWKLKANGVDNAVKNEKGKEEIPRFTVTNRNYDTVYISANFKTTFDKKNNNGRVIEGNYGLVFFGDELNPKTGKSKPFYCFLDVKAMAGDVYDFTSYYRQEKAFQLNPNRIYRNGKIQFFQNYVGVDGKDFIKAKDGFKIYSNTEKDNVSYIPLTEANEYDLFVKDINFSYGYSLDTYNDETVFLYTNNALSYNKTDKVKILELQWVHFKEDNTPILIKDISDPVLKNNSVKIHWYRYVANSDGTELSGKGWREISKALNSFSYKTNLDYNKAEEKFKVIITIDGEKYLSKELVFEKLDDEEDVVAKGINLLSNTEKSSLNNINGEYQVITNIKKKNNKYEYGYRTITFKDGLAVAITDEIYELLD